MADTLPIDHLILPPAKTRVEIFCHSPAKATRNFAMQHQTVFSPERSPLHSGQIVEMNCGSQETLLGLVLS